MSYKGNDQFTDDYNDAIDECIELRNENKQLKRINAILSKSILIFKEKQK